MPYIDPDSSADAKARPDRKAHDRELRAQIHGALHELSDEEHEAVALCVLGGLTQAEASKATGTNINTIKARVRRGTERLREKFKGKPEGIEAFLALPAFPHPSGGLEGALVRWVSAAKIGGAVSYIPRITSGQIALACTMLAAFVAIMTFLALNPPTNRGDQTARSSTADETVPLPDDNASGDRGRTLPREMESETPESTQDTSGSSRDPGSEDPPPNSAAEDYDQTSADTTTSDGLIPVESYYPNGELRTKGQYLKTPDGNVPHGTWTQNYPDGAIKDQGDFVNGLKHGIWIKRHPNGTVLSEGTFVDGKMQGLWHYYRDDETLFVRGEWLNDMKSGTWTIYTRDQEIAQTEVWQHNERNGWRRRFGPGSVLVSETEYANNKRNGRHIEYGPLAGRPLLETTYLNDVKHGVEVTYDAMTGWVVTSNMYRFGVRQDD